MKKILAISTIILGINSYSQTDDLNKIKSGESVNFNQFSARVTSNGGSSNFIKELE
jgi:hypothetical protein|tara:strand:- start:382 stop:549 length:168 start_codon:yes stop_codon:yes gene_type:complete